MADMYIQKPVGLEEIVEQIEQNCFKADVYNWLGYHHDHYIVNLSRNNGRTTLIRYMAEMYKAWDICKFQNSRREYLEFILSGSATQMDRVFAEIDEWAEHGEKFDGIVALDITNMARYGTKSGEENLFERFVNHCHRLEDSVYFLFFTHSQMDKREILFCDRLQSRLNNVRQVYLSPYTYDDFALIIENSFIKIGMTVENYEEFHPFLAEFVSDCGIETVPEALRLAKQIAEYADTDRLISAVSKQSVENLITQWDREAGM